MNQRFPYLLICSILFVIEIAIAKHVIGGAFVRGYIGDVLVIGLIHFFFRGVLLTAPLRTAACSVIFGFLVEGLQALHFAELLGLKKGGLFSVAIGNSFSIADLLMYLIGGVLALSIDTGLRFTLAHLGRNTLGARPR